MSIDFSRKRLIRWIIFVSLPLAVIAAVTEPYWNWARRALPADIKIDAVVAATQDSGFMEGCQSAVYRLPKEAAEAVERNGLLVLSDAMRPPNESDGNRYDQWRETPGDIDVANNGHGAHTTYFGLYAMGGCHGGEGQDFHSKELREALSKPGSYYRSTANSEGIIIVAPRQRLAAYFYVG